ncbi:hypothetical protein [[Erwinia] mediterraneensis]|uniref:hypothetical protein n=1 Tax=[Erwinia] mediterraneensis TaxID=2161819 RepID=UPI0010317412|nr:hypothetical protein [[Erwinia] mediterraneensis]
MPMTKISETQCINASTQTENVESAVPEKPLGVTTISVINHAGNSLFTENIKSFMDRNGHASSITCDDTLRFAEAIIRVSQGENWKQVSSRLPIKNKVYQREIENFIIARALEDIANGETWKQVANKYDLNEQNHQDVLQKFSVDQARKRIEENDAKNRCEIAKAFDVPAGKIKDDIDDIIDAAKKSILSNNPRHLTCSDAIVSNWRRDTPSLVTNKSDNLENPVPVNWQEVAGKYQINVESLKYSVLQEASSYLYSLNAKIRDEQHWADEDIKFLKDILTAYHYEDSATELLRTTVWTGILEKSVEPVLNAGFKKDQLITALVQVAKVLKNHKHARYLESFIQKHQKLSEEGFDLRKLIAEHESTTNIDTITKKEKFFIYRYGNKLLSR